MDAEDLLPGTDWHDVILETIKKTPIFIVCLSNNSVNKQGIIKVEIHEALEVAKTKLQRDIYIIPVLIEKIEFEFIPTKLRKYQWVDLFNDNGFKRLTQ